jgi:hypothetical protein
MEFLIGLVVGWFSMPYVLVGTILFFSGFPIFFWGYDLYDDDRWKYNFGRTIFFMLLTGAALHFLTPFDVAWLIANDFWGSALRFWLYVLAYIGLGLCYAYVRWFFYVREYYKRQREWLGTNPDQADMDRAYKKRLSGYGSRLSLILKWIFHWPWSLLAWLLTDLLRSLFDLIIDGGRAIFGRGFGAMARAHEPAWMKEREQKERTTSEASNAKS